MLISLFQQDFLMKLIPNCSNNENKEIKKYQYIQSFENNQIISFYFPESFQRSLNHNEWEF